MSDQADLDDIYNLLDARLKKPQENMDHEKTVAPEALHETSSLGLLGEILTMDQRKKNAENAQWLRFAEAAMPAVFADVLTCSDTSCPGCQNNRKLLADFADAMVREAKERGRI